MNIVAVRIGNKYGPEYETYLEEKFGDEYLDYKKKVRRWI
jgi:protein-S-isoprenylcysteine O-methyltransferase Ste14